MGGFTQVWSGVSFSFNKLSSAPQLLLQSPWHFSGDIGEMLPNGTVKIIDRKKNLIKLSQGEYVALEFLENVYTITPVVEDVSKNLIYLSFFSACLHIFSP